MMLSNGKVTKMPDKKLTDSEIVSTLQKNIRDSERINSSYALLNLNLVKETFDLINRLQADSKRLKKVQMQLDDAMKMYHIIKAEAYKEFAEWLYSLFPTENSEIVVISRTGIVKKVNELLDQRSD